MFVLGSALGFCTPVLVSRMFPATGWCAEADHLQETAGRLLGAHRIVNPNRAIVQASSLKAARDQILIRVQNKAAEQGINLTSATWEPVPNLDPKHGLVKLHIAWSVGPDPMFQMLAALADMQPTLYVEALHITGDAHRLNAELALVQPVVVQP